MKFLLDEGLPVQLLGPLRRNTPHEFRHVEELKWKKKGDTFLYPDASARGFEGVLALDVDQLVIKKEWEAIRRSGIHHISLRQGRTVKGKKGLARVIGSFIAAMPWILDDLASADEQQIVEVSLFGNSARHKSFDAKSYPPSQ